VIDESLESFYRLNFELTQGQFNYSLTEVENLMPWEREIYTYMIIKRLQEEKEERAKNAS